MGRKMLHFFLLPVVEIHVAVIHGYQFPERQVALIPGNGPHVEGLIVLEDHPACEGGDVHLVEIHELGISLAVNEKEALLVETPACKTGLSPFTRGKIRDFSLFIPEIDVRNLVAAPVAHVENPVIIGEIGDAEHGIVNRIGKLYRFATCCRYFVNIIDP